MAQVAALPATPEARALSARVSEHRDAVERLKSARPTAKERVLLLQTILDLQVEVMDMAKRDLSPFEIPTGIRRRAEP
jgi:hypothetical protein